MAGSKRYSREVRERAVRMVFEHEGRHGSRWETIRSIAGKVGCSTEALRNWVKHVEVDTDSKDAASRPTFHEYEAHQGDPAQKARR